MSNKHWFLLLVDDNPAECELACEAAEEYGQEFLLQTRWTPAEAEAVIAAKQPDLVLIDLHLGRWNGRELLPRLQGRHGAIILSTAAHPHESRACLAAGARDFWIKPLLFADYFTFFERVRNLLLGDARNPQWC